MSLWKPRWITAITVLIITIAVSFFIETETPILAITNTTFIVGLFILMIGVILYISVKWAFRVFRYGFGERLREDRNFNTSSKADINAAVELSSGDAAKLRNTPSQHNYGVGYEVDPEVLRERQEYEMKKKNREKQVYAIPLTTALLLLAVSVIFNILYYM